MEKTKTIIVSSEFPAGAEVIWNRLLDIGTLQHIANPMMTFKPILQKSDEGAWTEGGAYVFKIRLFGLIPIGGCHTIAVKGIVRKHYVLQTHEYNRTVTVWDHRIALKPMSNGNTHYSDIVEIYAGWLTPVVAVWSKVFYRHRQKKWKKLLRVEKAKR